MTTIVRTQAWSFLVRAAACIVVLSAFGCAPTAKPTAPPAPAPVRTLQRQPDWLLLGKQERGGDIVRIGGPLDLPGSPFQFRGYDRADPLIVQLLPGGRIAYLGGKGEITKVSAGEKVVVPLQQSASAPAEATRGQGAPGEAKIPLSGFATRKLIRNGEPTGPATMVLQGYSGSTLVASEMFSRPSEGRPESGTVAILEPATSSQNVVTVSLDGTRLQTSKFGTWKLVFEADARDMSPLLGQGAVYLIPPGVKELRLGNFVISTLGVRDWSAIQMPSPPAQPTVKEGTGVEIRSAGPN